METPKESAQQSAKAPMKPFPQRTMLSQTKDKYLSSKTKNTQLPSSVSSKRERHPLSKSITSLELQKAKEKPMVRSTTRRLSVPSKYATPTASNSQVKTPLPSSIPESQPEFVAGPFTSKTKAKALDPETQIQRSIPVIKRRPNTIETSSTLKESQRARFNALASSSYWLSQIKLAEAVKQHSIAIGFFKLALQSNNEPLERVKEELKSYVKRYGILNLGKEAEAVLGSYGIQEEANAENDGKFEEINNNVTKSAEGVDGQVLVEKVDEEKGCINMENSKKYSAPKEEKKVVSNPKGRQVTTTRRTSVDPVSVKITNNDGKISQSKLSKVATMTKPSKTKGVDASIEGKLQENKENKDTALGENNNTQSSCEEEECEMEVPRD